MIGEQEILLLFSKFLDLLDELREFLQLIFTLLPNGSRLRLICGSLSSY